MRPLRWLQLATGLLLLPWVLAGAIVLGTLAEPAAGGLVTLLALGLTLLLPVALGLGTLLGLLALIWAVRSGTLPQMWGWLWGFLLALGAFVLGLGRLTNGIRLP
ncbi:hypothetical protein [Meiothermus cerbereus]|jgi:hypothetical protein|uniref:hypothetical protein n=1 Tax=Meiothermus cerbereus TaxID=65552 RepID=UPI00047FA9AB|nr:hypothetical protein [Meiothermus cerbereus]